MADLDNRPGVSGAGPGMAPLCRFRASVLESSKLVPVLLEFEQPPVAVFARQNPGADVANYRERLATIQRQFLRRLDSLCGEYPVGRSSVVVEEPEGAGSVVVTHQFVEVFNGIGVMMPGALVKQIACLEEVRTVTLNEEQVYLTLEQSVPFVGAPRVWDRTDSAGRPIRGEGVVVAVIDTGIDWLHPVFGGFEMVPNEKVIDAISYTGEDPIDNYGHGTHVAGIIAGNAGYMETPRGAARLDGVAPAAKLIGYKVLTAAGSGSATNIIRAIEDAVGRGVDVINLSLGDSFGDPFGPESSAANNAMLAGVIVVAAAGNAGPERRTVGAPGAAQHVITVGASTDDGVTALEAQLRTAGSTEAHPIEMRLLEGSVTLTAPARELTYVDCGTAMKPEDFPPDVNGRIALIRRGDVSFHDKALGAERAGAIAAVIYNNRDGNFFGSLGEFPEMPTIPVVSISKQDGELMLGAIDDAGPPDRASLELNPTEIPQPNRMAEFSSRGPNRASMIKPELTAPGVNIDSSTVQQAASPGEGMEDPTGYISASGTSMAAPHVAGAAALLRQAHPQWTPLQIKAALVNTAQFMEGQGSVIDQGNGAMDLRRALDCQAVLVTATTPANPTYSFGMVVNQGRVKKVVQSLRVGALPEQLVAEEYRLFALIADQPSGLRAELSASSLTCPPGGTVTFDLTLTADGADLVDGAYHGWVSAEASWGTLTLPFYYEGVRRAMSKPPAPVTGSRQNDSLPVKRIGMLPLR